MCPSSAANLLIRLLVLTTASTAATRTMETTDPCPPDHVACGEVVAGKRECILHSDVCDGVQDCILENFEHWDEHNCAPQACNNGAVFCSVGRKCVRAELRCDGTLDCLGSGEDEQGCPADGSFTFRGVRYAADQKYACGSGERRWIFTLCNGLEDCTDGSDEIGYELETCLARNRMRVRYHGLASECGPGSVRCVRSSDSLNRCVLAKKVCDSYVDCVNGEDERSCPLRPTTTAAPAPPQPSVSGTRLTPRAADRGPVDLTTVRTDVVAASTSRPAAAAATRSRSELDLLAGLEDSIRVVKGMLVCLCVACTVALFVVLATRGRQLWRWRTRRAETAEYASHEQL